MPTRKLRDLPTPCSDPEHEPPTMMVYENGWYEHECPTCGRKKMFLVIKPTL